MSKKILSTQQIVNLPSDPATGTSGEIYYNTTDNALKYYDGSAWQAIGGGGTSVNIQTETALSNSFWLGV